MRSPVTILFVIAISIYLFPANAHALYPEAFYSGVKVVENKPGTANKKELFKIDILKMAEELSTPDFLNYGSLINAISHFSPRSKAATRSLSEDIFIHFFALTAGSGRFKSQVFANRFTVVLHSLKLIYPHHSFW